MVALAFALGGVYGEEFPGLSAVAQYGLPTPPMQHSPWKPPPGALEDVFAGAVAVLCEEGLPDPRGCEYREVKVPRLLLVGPMQLVQTHGWVLPPGPGQGRFAICWDGLIYPVVDVGKSADLKADVAAALRHEEDLRVEYETDNPGLAYSRAWGADAPQPAVEPDDVLPLRACFLLRLGQEDLAEQVWGVVVQDFGTSLRPALHRDDPCLVFAVEWARAKYQRALTCHCRGIGPLALADLKGLDGLGGRLADVAAGRGFRRDVARGLLGFLDDVPTMLADQQHRRGVEDLIHDLQDVHVEPRSVPLTLDYADSATMVELVLQDDGAVGPLLHAMTNEGRLSRTATYSQPLGLPGAPVPVRELEALAVWAMLGEPPLADAPQLRTWWEANADRPAVERLYATLADNDAAPEMWLWAARRIVQPGDEAVEPVERLSPARAVYPLRAAAPRWAGEPLRDERQASVSDLMARRALALSQMGQAENDRIGRLEDATRLGVWLARWDPQAALQTLRTLDRSWHDLLGGRAVESSQWPDVSRMLADLTIARLHTGDGPALADYVAWVQAGYARDTRPLWLSSQDPAVVGAVKWLLEHGELPQATERLDGEIAPGAPMLAVEPFRQQVLWGLEETDQIGNVRIDYDGTVRAQYRGWTGPMPLERPDPGTRAPVRVCDSFAWNLSRLAGFPKFNPFAPLAERDRAIKECTRILTEKGDRFSLAIDTGAFWTQWLRGHGEPDDQFIEAVFKPERALQAG